MKTAGFLSFGLILLLFVLGVFYPQQFWGINFLAFFNQTAVFATLGAAALIVLAFHFTQISPKKTSDKGYVIRLVFAAIMMFLFWQFPIAFDRFGDAFGIRPQLDYTFENWDNRLLTELLKFNYLDPKLGAETFFSLISLTSFLFQENCLDALIGLELFALGLFIWFWGGLVYKSLHSLPWRITLMLVGATAPFLLVYQAHAEIYALPITFVAGFLLLAKKVEDGSASWPWMFVSLLVGIKLHFMLWLLVPMAVVITLRQQHRIPESFSRIISPRGIIQWLIPIGLFAIGGFYFIYQGGIEGQRTYSSDDLYSALLLPVKAIEGAPFDRYGLFSSAHFLDMINMILFWSPAVWVILFVAAVSRGLLVNYKWISVLVMTLVAFVALQFIQNPLLGLTIDRDLYSIPAPLFLALGLALCSAIENKGANISVPASIAVIALLSFSSFIVRANDEKLSQQYETIGLHHFKTYWLGGSSPIQYALELDNDKNSQLARMDNILAELEPYSVIGLDEEFAEILRKAGRLQQDSFADINSAIVYYERCVLADPLLRKGVFDLTIAYFIAGRINESADLVPKLVKMEYPSSTKAMRIGIHISLAAGRNDAAIAYSKEYVQLWPEDEGISWAHELMEAGKWTEALDTFRSK